MAELDEDEFDRWRGQADRTLDTVALATRGERHEWACFLAEQASQLALKGLLHAIGEQAWGHDLTVLERRASAALHDLWSACSDEVARLSRHYIASRYPDAHPSGMPGGHYTAADASAAMADARAVLAAVDRAWELLRTDGQGKEP